MGHLYIFTFYLHIFGPFMVSIQIYYCTKSHFKLINNQNKEFFYVYSGTEPYDMRKCHVQLRWEGCTGRIPFYSGRKLIRLGSASDWRFLISDAVTLQDSKESECKFFKGFKYCKPSRVMQEFETFKDTNAVSPTFKKETTWQLKIKIYI